MRNSLILKLMGAFALVILIGSLVTALLTSQATRSAFNLYTTRSGQVWAWRRIWRIIMLKHIHGRGSARSCNLTLARKSPRAGWAWARDTVKGWGRAAG
jgi:hypothetical protein